MKRLAQGNSVLLQSKGEPRSPDCQVSALALASLSGTSHLGVRWCFTPLQLQDGPRLSTYTLASCSAIMQNFKTTLNPQHLGVLKTKHCLSVRPDFHCETLTASQDQSSCWTNHRFHTGSLAREGMRPRFPHFLGTKSKSC